MLALALAGVTDAAGSRTAAVHLPRISHPGARSAHGQRSIRHEGTLGSKRSLGSKQSNAHQGSNLIVTPLALGTLIATLTVALQVFLKLASRQPPKSKRHGLRRDDLVWWLDWVVAAVISFTLLALSTARSHGSLSGHTVTVLVVCFLAGLLGLPTFVRTWGYDERGRAKSPALRTINGVVLPNLVGAAILLAAIASGAQLAA